MKQFITVVLVSISIAFLLGSPGNAQQSRFTFADQSKFAGNQGFYIDAENSIGSAAASSLSNLKLYAGIANGTRWQYLGSNVTFRTGHQYDVDLTIKSGVATLVIDGAQQAQATAILAPVNNLLTGDNIPSWASSPTDYYINESSVQIAQAKGAPLSITCEVNANPFSAQASGFNYAWTYLGGDLNIDIKFSILKSGPSTDLSVDQYGQPTFVDYEGKIHSDADFAKVIRRESDQNAKWMKENPFDQWGGLANTGYVGSTSGYYCLTKRNGFWWLIDPSGNPCFYTGVDAAESHVWDGTPVTGRERMYTWLPGSDKTYADAQTINNWGADPGVTYVEFSDANLIRKYGVDNWLKRNGENRDQRLKAWGFSGLGKWDAIDSSVPSLPVLEWNGVPNLIRRPDFFDPATVQKMRATIIYQMSGHLTDPKIVGWSLGNEFDEVITTDEIRKILALPESNPSRKALMNYASTWSPALSSPPSDSDLEKLRQFYANKYYGFTHDLIKSIDPNHLFFGFWLAVGWWQNASDWSLQEAHVDALGIDVYDQSLNSSLLTPLIARCTVPVVIGEFGFPANYDMTRGFGSYGDAVSTDLRTGQLYDKWIHDSSINPNIIGDSFFEFYDEPLTGRGPGHGSRVVYGENYAFGLVRETDTPKWDLLDGVRDGNLHSVSWRSSAERMGLR